MKLVSIYVISEVNGDHVKVGISDSPNSRLATLQTANFRRLELSYATPGLERSRAMEVERIVHDALAIYRMAGEWFKCTPAVAIESIQCCIEPLVIPDPEPNPLKRVLRRHERGAAVAALLFEYACETWGHDAFSYDTFAMLMDFGMSVDNADFLLDTIKGHQSWADARRALFVASGYPEGNYGEGDE